jgi:hypothetical protein
LIDHESLAQAQVEPKGSFSIGRQHYDSLVLPSGVELPNPAAANVRSFSEAGGCVLRDGDEMESSKALLDALQPAAQIRPASERIVLGRFRRDGRDVLVTANVGAEAYQGALSHTMRGDWLALDPASGKVEPAGVDQNGDISLDLEPRQTRLLVSAPSIE